MADIKEVVEDENKIGTVINSDIHFKGTLKFKNSLKIKGSFEGKIETDGHFIVGEEAKVSADIKAGIVAVNGTMNGKINSSKRIELYEASKTKADLVSPDLVIETGASFNGTCIMNS